MKYSFTLNSVFNDKELKMKAFLKQKHPLRWFSTTWIRRKVVLNEPFYSFSGSKLQTEFSKEEAGIWWMNG